MLSQKDIAALAALAKIDVAKLKTAIDAPGEVAVEGFDADNHGLTVLTAQELADRDTNSATKDKKKYQDEGIEIAVRKMKKALSLEDITETNLDQVIPKIKEGILKVAKLPIEQAETEKDKKIAVLTASLEKAEADKANAEKAVAGIRIERETIGAFPANRSADMDDDERLLLFNARYERQEKDGAIVYVDKKSGKELRDTKTGNPLPLTNVVGDFFTERKWTSADPKKDGRGGKGDNPPGPGGGGGLPVTWTEARDQWVGLGKSINNPEFSTWVGKLSTDNPAFDMTIPAE